MHFVFWRWRGDGFHKRINCFLFRNDHTKTQHCFSPLPPCLDYLSWPCLQRCYLIASMKHNLAHVTPAKSTILHAHTHIMFLLLTSSHPRSSESDSTADDAHDPAQDTSIDAPVLLLLLLTSSLQFTLANNRRWSLWLRRWWRRRGGDWLPAGCWWEKTKNKKMPWWNCSIKINRKNNGMNVDIGLLA